jgi:hypothetical protein
LFVEPVARDKELGMEGGREKGVILRQDEGLADSCLPHDPEYDRQIGERKMRRCATGEGKGEKEEGREKRTR